MMARWLLTLLIGGVLASVILAHGARLRRIFGFPVDGHMTLPTDFALGSWGLGFISILCGMIGLTNPVILSVVVGLLGASGKWRGNRWEWGGVLPGALASMPMLPLVLGPPYLFFDALVYHLALPWQAIQEGRIAAHPENYFSFFPPVSQGLALLPLRLGADSVPALLHLLSFVAAAGGVTGIARIMGAPRWIAATAGFCLPLLPSHALVPALPAAEGWALLGVLAAVALVMSTATSSPGWAVGLFLGIACAARMQGLVWAVLVAAAAFLLRRPSGAQVAKTALGWLVGSAPWWLKNALLLGTPYLPLGARPEGIGSLVADSVARPGWERGIWAATSALAEQLAPHAAYLLPLLLAGTLAVVRMRNRRGFVLAGLALAGIAAWDVTGALPRFLHYSFALLLVLGAIAARENGGKWAALLSLGATAALGLVYTSTELRRLDAIAIMRGSAASIVRSGSVNDPQPLFREAVRLPPAARVLFVGECRGYRFPRRFVAVSQHDGSPLRDVLEQVVSTDAVRTWMRERGYSHLLINWSELRRLTGKYPVQPWRSELGRERWMAFLKSLGPPVLSAGGVDIYSVEQLAVHESRPHVSH